MPPSCRFRNNFSALREHNFVSEAILELLQDHRVEELDVVPDVVNPSSVSAQACARKRLFLDLRRINLHIYKSKFKCEGLHTIIEIFSRDRFVFSFDLRSRYQHVDIFPEHRKFLAFFWDFDARAQTRYFQFTVLPFGLSSAPFIFTKLLKTLEIFWRSQGIPIEIFFDDGVGVGASFPVAQNNSEFVRLSLVKSGFLVNREKSLWGPTRRFSWIGYVIETHSGIISASDSRMEKCSADLNEVCATLEMSSSVHVKALASLVGQIISFGSSFGNIT